MAVKNILNEIENDIADVVSTNFVYNNTNLVPNGLDGQLTYERGIEKKGKKIETCVLYVDIRNSVGLTVKHHTQTMGRIYTAFTKAILKVARHHNGHIRNIIGDRVMIVFPVENSFKNAVECAISINHIAKYIINKQFVGVDFKCGIGIDFGELRVIKVGIQRHGTERGENKGLVWVGYPANIASRLTDNANKKITETYYNVVRNPINPRYHFKALGGLGNIGSPFSKYNFDNEPLYNMKVEETKRMTTVEFAESVKSHTDGSLYIVGGNFIRFTKETEEYDYSSILMTEAVFNGYKRANPSGIDIQNNFWKEQKHQIKNVTGKIYGGDINWIIK
ncbi:adenylate/guanylate cyclase domain-containing protein [Flavobacterium sp. ZS1P14]